MARAEAKIPLRVEDKAARDAIKAFNRDFKSSLGEINAAVALIGKAWRAVSSVVTEVAKGLEWGVKAALKAEGAASQFGRRLEDAKKATNDLAIAIGKTVTKSESWNALLDVAKSFTETMTAFFKSSEGRQWVEGFGRALAAVLSAAAAATRGLLATVTSPKRVAASQANWLGRAFEWGLEKTGIADDPLGAEFYKAVVGTREEILKNEFSSPNQNQLDRALAKLQANLDRVAAGEYQPGKPRSRIKQKKSTWTPDEAMKRLEDVPGNLLYGSQAEARQEIAFEQQLAADRFEADKKMIAERDRLTIQSLRRQEVAAERQAALNARKRADEDAYLEHQEEMLTTLKEQTAAFLTGGIAAAAAAIGAGENVLQSIGSFVGGAIQTFGQMLLQIGIAGLFLGKVGTAIPVLAPATGGPIGIGASLAAIGAGTVMIGVGSAMSSRSAGGGSARAVTVSSSYGGGASEPGAGYSSAYGFGSGAPGMATMRVTNVYLGQGVVVAPSPSEAGRQIRGFLRAAEARGY